MQHDPVSLDDSLDALASQKRRYQPGPRCGIEILQHALSAEEYEKLLAAINNPTISGASISDVMHAYGYEVSPWVIHRHRRRGTGRGCRCPQ